MIALKIVRWQSFVISWSVRRVLHSKVTTTGKHVIVVIIHYTSFLIGRKSRVNFRNQGLWRHNCRLCNNHVKGTQGHGYSCRVWPRCVVCKGKSWQVRALCGACRQWRSKNMTFLVCRSMYNTTIIRFGLSDVQNNQGRGKGYQQYLYILFLTGQWKTLIVVYTILRQLESMLKNCYK